MLVRNRRNNRAVFDPEIPKAGRIKQVWSSLPVESMRVKPVGTGNLDKLKSVPVVLSAWGSLNHRRGEPTVDAKWRRHLTWRLRASRRCFPRDDSATHAKPMEDALANAHAGKQKNRAAMLPN